MNMMIAKWRAAPLQGGGRQRAHRIYQVRGRKRTRQACRVLPPRSARPSRASHGADGVRDQVALGESAICREISNACYRYCRDNDLRAAEVITDPKGDRKRRAHEQDDPRPLCPHRGAAQRRHRGARRQAPHHAASLIHELVVMPTKGMRQDETPTPCRSRSR